MIQFKTIRWKHIAQLEKDAAEVDEAQANLIAAKLFLGLVKAWDFVDGDTGEVMPIPSDQESVEVAFGNLSIEQVAELNASIRAAINPRPNANGGPQS